MADGQEGAPRRPLTHSPEDLQAFLRLIDPAQQHPEVLVRSVRDAAAGVGAARLMAADWLREALPEGIFCAEAFHEAWEDGVPGRPLAELALEEAAAMRELSDDLALSENHPAVAAELSRRALDRAEALEAWAASEREDFLELCRVEHEWEEGATVDAVVRRLNLRYFTVTKDGGYAVGRIQQNPAFGHEEVAFFREAAIRKDLDRRRVEVQDGDRVVTRGQGSVFLEHPAREHFRHVTFDPDPAFHPGEGEERTLNTFRGFRVAGDPSCDASPIEDLMRVVLCGDDARVFDYLTRWCALSVQRPHEPAGVVAAMTGPKRLGKGAFGRAFLALSDPHSLQLTQMDQLTGKFNAHLASCLALFVDEAFWGGDRRAENVLKGIITEPSFMAEPKGVDAFRVPNRLNIAMATNDEWVAPTDVGDTRFLVLSPTREASDDYKRTVGFGRLLHGQGLPRTEVVAGWRARLERVDLDGWRAEDHVPETEGLRRQRELTALRDPMVSWWRDLLLRGGPDGGDVPGWPDRRGEVGPATKDQLVRDLHWHLRSLDWYRGDLPDKVALGRWVSSRLGYPVAENVGSGAARRKGWLLPPLAEARADFVRVFGTTEQPWDE